MPFSERWRRLVDTPLVRTVVSALLSRAMQPERSRVVRFHVKPDTLPAYFDALQAGPRLQGNRSLQVLADAGFVRLHWVKWQDGQWLEAVDLTPDAGRIAELYAACGLEPASLQRERLQRLVSELVPRQPWLVAFRDHVLARLAECKSPAPLKLDDLDSAGAVLAALVAIDRLEGSTWERHLSVQTFGDSKRFEDVRRSVIAVLKRFSPLVPADADDRTILRLHRVERTPELIHLAGPLHVQTSAGIIDVGAMRPYGAFPAVMDVVAWSVAARVIVTVENLTPFVAMAAERPEDVAIVYTGGFTSPALLTWLLALGAASPDVAWWHWGDIDVGGFRILAHLRAALPHIRPLAMDEPTLYEHRSHADVLKDTDVQALHGLQDDPLLGDCRAVIAAMAERRRKLEQEAVPVGRVCRLLAGYVPKLGVNSPAAA